MTINPDKYTTFKTAELADVLATIKIGDMISEALGMISVQDAVVIRHQDIFAGPALHTYAAAILNGISVATMLGDDMNAFEIIRLQELADYFADQAAAADQAKHKLPD